MAFKLAQYAINGTFIGFTELKAQLSLCPMSYLNVLDATRFGAITENECEFYLEDLVTDDPSKLPEDANVLYELYLEDSQGRLIDVPVLVRQYMQTGETYPNNGTAVVPEWKLVRRFIIVDTMSGSVKGSGSPDVVRWASSVHLKVAMDPESVEAILRPYLIIDYMEREADSVSPGARAPASLTVEYYSDYGPFLAVTVAALACLTVVALIVAGVRWWQYTRRNPKKALGGDAFGAYAGKASYYVLDVWSDLMFWLLFGACGEVFTAFKLQQHASLLLPELGGFGAGEDAYLAFYVLLGLTLACKLLAVWIRIGEQAGTDVYLVDHETPNRDTKQVNAWRHYFVANEFAEL